MATGRLLVHSLDPTGTVKAGAMARPIRGGSIDEGGIAFVSRNPATSDGSWPVTSSGVLVNVEALHGGPGGNTDAGTIYRWAPALSGIEETSAADGSGLAGGSYLTGTDVLKQVKRYKQLTKADLTAFFQAQLSTYPAACLAWEGMTPLGGAMGSSPGPRTARASRDNILTRNTWLLWIVSSRLDGEAERRDEGDSLRDRVVKRLHQREATRGLRISMAPGIEILEAKVFSVTPTSYVDVIRIATGFALQFEHDDEFQDWLRTRLVEETVVGADGLRIDIVDTSNPMPPNGTVP